MADRRLDRTGGFRLQPLLPLVVIWPAGIALLAVLALQRQVPYSELLLDPNSINKVPWYTGLVSNLGILGWTTATVAGLFGTWIARFGGRPGAAAMLGRGSLLSALLLLDDLFQLHVLVRPLLGLPKSVVYVGYLGVALWWVVGQHREIIRTRVAVLLAASAALGLSVVVDQATGRIGVLGGDAALLIEDAAKFLGVLAWAQYFVLTASDIVRSIINELRADRSEPKPADPSGPQAIHIDGGLDPALKASPAPRVRAGEGEPSGRWTQPIR